MQASEELLLLLRMLSLGLKAWNMIDSQVFKEAKLVLSCFSSLKKNALFISSMTDARESSSIYFIKLIYPFALLRLILVQLFLWSMKGHFNGFIDYLAVCRLTWSIDMQRTGQSEASTDRVYSCKEMCHWRHWNLIFIQLDTWSIITCYWHFLLDQLF